MKRTRWQLKAASAVAKSCKQQAITRTSQGKSQRDDLLVFIVIFIVWSQKETQKASPIDAQSVFNECHRIQIEHRR